MAYFDNVEIITSSEVFSFALYNKATEEEVVIQVPIILAKVLSIAARKAVKNIEIDKGLVELPEYIFRNLEVAPEDW